MTMTRMLLVASAGALILAYGCSDDEETTTTTQSTTRTTTTTTTTGPGGNGGMGTGGDATGGTAGGAECLNCGAYVLDFANNTEDELCGYVSGGLATGDLMCDPGSSCELLGAAAACGCTTCVADCGDNICMGMEINTACAACLGTPNPDGCQNETNACQGDGA